MAENTYYANVSVQRSSDQATHKGEHVTCGLKSVGRYTLIRDLVGVLTLIFVYKTLRVSKCQKGAVKRKRFLIVESLKAMATIETSLTP